MPGGINVTGMAYFVISRTLVLVGESFLVAAESSQPESLCSALVAAGNPHPVYPLCCGSILLSVFLKHPCSYWERCCSFLSHPVAGTVLCPCFLQSSLALASPALLGLLPKVSALFHLCLWFIFLFCFVPNSHRCCCHQKWTTNYHLLIVFLVFSSSWCLRKVTSRCPWT